MVPSAQVGHRGTFWTGPGGCEGDLQNAKVKAANETIGEDAWKAIACTRGAEAQVAETTIEPGRRGDKPRGPDGEAAKPRRSRLLGAQRELWPNWRYHSFVTDRDDLDTKAADAYHRAHATVELAIRDLKDNGLSPCPSEPPTAPGAAQHQPHPPPTRTSPPLQSCTPQNAPARTHPPTQRPPRPKPSIPQTRRWIQAKNMRG